MTLTAVGQTGEKNFIDQNYIEVVGFAEKEIFPDEIYLNILIDEKESRSKTLEQLERSMIKALKQLGIDVDEKLTIKDFVSDFKNIWLRKDEVKMVKEYQLLVHSGQMVAQVYGELEKLDISNINIARLDHSQLQKFRDEVKVDAIVAAREKAGSLSRAIGQDIGRAIYIQEYQGGLNMSGQLANVSGIVLRGTGMNPEMQPPAPNLDFEKLRMEYRVMVRFELK